MPRIVRAIDRPPRADIDALAQFSVSTIHEASHRLGLLSEAIRPLASGLRACGPAVTALCHAGDNLMVHAAIDAASPGDVLVVATLAPSTHGMVGELLATQARARGIAAIVIDAGVRDSAQLRRMEFPVWCRAVSPAGTTKSSVGWVNIPVTCGGTLVRPGDVIVADDDGVTVVPRDQARTVADRAAERDAKEATLRDRYAQGESGLDIHGLRALLEDADAGQSRT